MTPSRRHPAGTLAVALSLATAVGLSAPPLPAFAQARRATCPSSSTAHPKHGTPACSQSGRKSKSDAGPHRANAGPRNTAPRKANAAPRKANANRGARNGHSKRAVRKKPKEGTNKAKQRAISQAAASCEDGSAPIQASDGSFFCDDGSEPGCENGANPIPSRDHSTLVCEIGSGEDAIPSEAGSPPSDEIPSEEGALDPSEQGAPDEPGIPGQVGAGGD